MLGVGGPDQRAAWAVGRGHRAGRDGMRAFGYLALVRGTHVSLSPGRWAGSRHRWAQMMDVILPVGILMIESYIHTYTFGEMGTM